MAVMALSKVEIDNRQLAVSIHHIVASIQHLKCISHLISLNLHLNEYNRHS